MCNIPLVIVYFRGNVYCFQHQGRAGPETWAALAARRGGRPYIYIYIYILYREIDIYIYICCYVFVYMCIYIYIYMIIDICIIDCIIIHANHRLFHAIWCYSVLLSLVYGQFSKCHVCFCGLAPGNLKFGTVRTNRQHICF